MGEDIHHKSYAKLKSTGKYIDLSSLEISAGDTLLFPPIMQGRSYPLFSLLGSRRGDWKMLPCLEYGFPKDVIADNPWINEWKNVDGNNWYGYVHANRADFIKGLEECSQKLESPKTYYTNEDDEDVLLDITESPELLKYWTEEAQFIKSVIQKEWIPALDLYKSSIDLVDPIIDVNSIVDVFWFDC